jgi:hypothetical protein
MTFYLRRSREAAIEGPFSIEQINQMVRQKRFAFNSLALADTGQGLQELGSVRANQWIKVADIPGFEPDPAKERNCLLIALVILIVLGIVVVIGVIKLMDVLRRI